VADAGEYYYLPWIDKEHNLERGIREAKRLAARRGLPLVALMATKNHLPEYLKGVAVVTTRTGGLPFGAFVAAAHPSPKVMARFFHEGGPFMVVDSHRDPLRGWAEAHGAVNLLTGETLRDQRPDEVRRIHAQLRDIGYNGFTSPPGSYSVRSQLERLAELGWLDEPGKDYLVATMFGDRSDTTLEELRKIADTVSPRR
jgi:hypothetical protein